MTTIQGRVPVIERNESHGWFVYASDEEFHYLTDHGWHHCCPVFFTTREAAQAFIDAHADLAVTLTPELLAKGERYAGKEINLHDTMDAVAWTNEFCRINPCADHAFMLGWFANAIMAGYDEAMRPVERAEVTVACYLTEDDPPEDHDLHRYSAVCGQCYGALADLERAAQGRLSLVMKLVRLVQDTIGKGGEPLLVGMDGNPRPPLADLRRLADELDPEHGRF